MRNIFFLIIFSVVNSYICFSQQYVSISDNGDVLEIINNNTDELVFHNNLSGFYISDSKLENDIYTKIFISGYYSDNIVGHPELPVITKLIEIPYGADIKINILSESETIVNLSEYGIDFPIIPNQPSLRKDQDPRSVKVEKNKKIYRNKEYYSTDLIKVEKIGVMRGIQVAQLIISPFSYDIESNELIIKNNIEVKIEFENSNLIKTLDAKKIKYSPAFESSYKSLWNYKKEESKDLISKYPIKYVIISDRMFENTLQPFVKWKIKKGFNVITAYTDEIGNTTTEIKNYLRNLYNSGTIEDPAPTYLLIVGDTYQVPSFQAGNHVTDLYYCEFDGDDDYIPEMYYGRFSARTIQELLPQVEKTLMYEKYTFPDPLFLMNSVLVAGNDVTHGPVECNGQVSYAENYYFNQEHGVNASTYYYPESNNFSSEIISKINDGVGFLNYTAHCDYKGWAGPSFKVNNVHNLTNENEYFFSIGNCCLSNKFDEPECFGEALLRADKKGAVVHLGGSHNTYWHEDYYWSVGLTENINSSPTYEETGPGVYDHLFHEGGELAYITAGQMNYAGNMSVMGSTSSLKQYYWEIYHVMGDPSIMPYVGIPEQLYADHDPVVAIGMTYFHVNTEPGAYVAVTNNGNIISAGICDSEGFFRLEFEPFTGETVMDIVITKQFKIPYISTVDVINNDKDNDVILRKINNPLQLLHITESAIIPSFDIMNSGNLNLQSVIVGYSINNGEPVENEWNGDLSSYETTSVSFTEIELEDGVYNFSAYAVSPNGVEDENPSNNELERVVKVYSGNVSLIEIVSPAKLNCNTSVIIPEIIIKNNDSYPLTSLKCSYECGSINEEIIWEGCLEQGETQNIDFSSKTFANGNYSINFYITEPNNGTNINNFTQLSTDFEVKSIGYLLELDFLTDLYGHENSWALVDMISGDTIFSDGNFAQHVITHKIYNWCLSPGCYKFIIFDSYGDGMKGSFIGGYPPGAVKIKNLDNEDFILDLLGTNSDFNKIYTRIFCLDYDDVVCPLEKVLVKYEDALIRLNECAPEGGIYSGEGIIDGVFNPYELGEGTHEVRYSYMFDGVEKYCNFEIDIRLVNIESDKSVSMVNIYPNPTLGLVNIDVDITEKFDVEIVNVFGQIVEKYYDINKNLKLNISHLTSGSYFIKIRTNSIVINEKIYLLK